MSNQVKFSWIGKDNNGYIVQGEISARNKTIAKLLLQKRGLHLIKIYNNNHVYSFTHFFNNCYQDITQITSQTATLLAAGVPLLQSLQTVSKSLSKIPLQLLLANIVAGIAGGSNLSTLLRQHPHYFDPVYCSLVTAAEQAGCLDDILLQLAKQREQHTAIKQKITNTLIYPVVTLITALVVGFVLLRFVVPSFDSLFSDFGAKLPWLTRCVIALSQWFQSNFSLILIFIPILIVFRMIKTTRSWESVIMHIPLIGKLFNTAAIIRFCSTLRITYSAGISLAEGITTAGNTTGRQMFRHACEKIAQGIAEGEMLHQAMHKCNIFPEIFLQMIYIGEQTGALERILVQLTDFYQCRLDNSIARLSTLLEPTIIALLGIIIGGLVFAMYLPIFKLGSVV